MNKYSNAWYSDIMKSRGFESNNNIHINKWTKLIGDITDECFWIYADIDIDDKTIKLSSNILKQLIHLETPYFQIDHPNYIDFENKLIEYIESCLQNDIIKDVIYERQQSRRNKNK